MPIQQAFETDIPARLDRLPWSKFHWLILTALGVTWILDGLEVTIVGSLSGALEGADGLSLSATQIGLAASLYIVGAVTGALIFGQLADRYGRRKLFLVTVGLYLAATIATGLSWNFASFAVCRILTGAGIGGEYSAINSAIQEFTPARLRGRVDLLVNGSYWIGAALGAVGSLVVLDPALVPQQWGWRLAFILGGILAGAVMFLRRYVPESPRWLLIHGRSAEAEAVMRDIEKHVVGRGHGKETFTRIRLQPRDGVRLSDLTRSLFRDYPSRSFLGLTLMATQAFCYNAIFFTYALVLTNFYGIASNQIGWFMLPFAAGNFLGPLLLGPLFDNVGRKTMIALSYGVSGLLMALTGLLFAQGYLDAQWQTALWTLNFFFASAGASAAYLTVGESFPLEVRARAIAIFYAFGTALGGIIGPVLFGALIESGARVSIAWGYGLGAGLMLLGALVEARIGIAAEGRSLEDVAAPLSKL
ncbi:MAG TPA: MFS transporter [Rhizomicrobium sp.]